MKVSEALSVLRNAAWLGTDDDRQRIEQAIEVLSAQPTADRVARDISTILQNEQDMRVIERNAEPERKKGKWIPVTERLPEERQEILATTTDNSWGDVVIIRTYYKEMHKSVIAWMPLPEPYKEGE